MQRFFIPFGNVSTESARKLQTAFNSLVDHEKKLAKATHLADKKFIELVELKQLINEINMVWDTTKDESSKAAALQTLLTNRWSRIMKIPAMTYPHASDAPQTVFCLALARMLHASSPNQFPSVYQLLMPTLKSVAESDSKKKLDDLPLGSFMLSKDGAYPVPLSILEHHCNQLINSESGEKAGSTLINHYKEGDQSNLTEAECDRLIAFSEEGKALYDAAKKYANIAKKPDYFQVGRQLQLLRQGLERARAASGGGELGIDGDYAVIEFSEYFNTLSEDQRKTILNNASIKSIWDKLSKPAVKGTSLCIQGMNVIKELDGLLANNDFLYDKAIELEKADEQYQRALKRFKRAATSGDFMLNEEKTDNSDNFIAALRTLVANKDLADQCLSIPNVASFIHSAMFDQQLIDVLAARYEVNWLNVFKSAGIATDRLNLFFIDWIRTKSIIKVSQKVRKELIFDLLTSENAAAQLYEVAAKNQDDYLLGLLIQSKPGYLEGDSISKNLITQLYDVAAQNKNEPLFKLLLQYQPNVLCGDFNGHSSIVHYYASKGKYQTIEFLSKMGVKADDKDKNGETVLTSFAKQKSFLDLTFKDIIQSYPELINVPNAAGDTPLALAVINNDREKVEILLKTPTCDINFPNAKGQTPLDLACEHNHSRIARWLLEKGALGDMNKIAKQFLHCFIKDGGGKDNVIKTLIAHHVDLSQTDQVGNSPLFNAVVYGSDDVVQQILKAYPAGVYYKNAEGKLTPLDIAIFNGQHQGMMGKIKLLLPYYSQEYFKSGGGLNAVRFAVTKNLPDLVILLLEAGVPLTTPVPGYISLESWAATQHSSVQSKFLALSENNHQQEVRNAKVRIAELEAKVRVLESTIAALDQHGMFAQNQATNNAQSMHDQQKSVIQSPHGISNT